MNFGTVNVMFIVLLCLTTCNTLTITNVAASDIFEREVNPHSLFPDWVPFKNKQGNDLGEFTSVQRKKPRKRLAQPSNFVMRAADGEEDDYYAKGLDDSEEVYESKDWSDLQRKAVEDASSIIIDLNHADLSDIEGIVPTVPPSVDTNHENVNRRSHGGRRDRERQINRPNSIRQKQEYANSPQPTEHQSTEMEHTESYRTEQDVEYERNNHEVYRDHSELIHPFEAAVTPSLSKSITHPVILERTTTPCVTTETTAETELYISPTTQEHTIRDHGTEKKLLKKALQTEKPKDPEPTTAFKIVINPDATDDKLEDQEIREENTQKEKREPEEVTVNSEPEQLKVEDYDSHVPIRHIQDETKEKSAKGKRDENSKEIDQTQVAEEGIHRHSSHESTNINLKEKREDNLRESDQTHLIRTEDEEYDENVQNQKRRSVALEKKPESTKVKTQVAKSDDEEEYDETSVDKKETSSKEQRENEERKRLILSAVDLLKERHAKEQRLLSERLREEELERDNSPTIDHFNKYSLNSHKLTDFDDYDQQDSYSVKDKYKLKPLVKTQTTTTSTTEKTTPVLIKKHLKNTDTGKMSIFKNPRPYMMGNDEYVVPENNFTQNEPSPVDAQKVFATIFDGSESSNEEPSPENMIPTFGQNKRVSKMKPRNKKGKYVLTSPATKPTKLENYQPATTESTAAFSYPTQKKRKYEYGNDNETESTNDLNNLTVSPISTTRAKSLSNRRKNATNVFDVIREITEDKEISIGSEGTTGTEDNTAVEATSGGEWSKVINLVHDENNDTQIAGSKKNLHITKSPAHEEKPKDAHFEKGGEKEHYIHHGSTAEEHGKKAYEGIHKDTKSEKGHHDKENHEGDYHDKGGHNLHHHDEKTHYGAHQHEEHGKKHAQYEESGKHSKGHSTKGSHDIHKKEEYEKKVEFFEEDGDSDEEEYSGGHIHKRDHASGGHHKKGNLAAYSNHREGGENGFFVNGGLEDVDKGHKSATGHDSHGKRGSSHHGQDGKQSGKKWIFHHGYPAKTANLVVIDRNDDNYRHDLFFG